MRLAFLLPILFFTSSLWAEMSPPRLDMQEALSKALSTARDWKPDDSIAKPRFPTDIHLVEDAEWGLIWIVIFNSQGTENLKTEYSRLITPWTYEVHVNMEGSVNSQWVAYFRRSYGKDRVATGTPIPGKQGFCSSPHGFTASMVDVRYFSPGTIIRCPYSTLPFIIPETNSKK